ncbi:histone-lysine N-methyltransferase 2D isoform X3 [Ochotona princeps]|uniref:histone-lysine N-methyltransferase 2D isoform X3 n=1 Tax=Ochotona princeps TaxID=9978 RepID=UPI0027144E58|nr:histone-lysine N-methyltransferase 2D isoform X3 [Ochotona princeps]
MDSQKPPGEDKDSEPAADGAAASEEPDLPGPPVGEGPVPSPGSARLQEPRRDCSGGPVRRCALCNCGEPSLHGQRELRRFELPFDWPRCPVVSPGGSPGPREAVLSSEDLSQIGFPEGLTPAHLGEPGGFCWAHHWCAAWSAGVWGQEGPELCGVDKAIFSGISQRCSHCTRLGASIPCRSPGCPRLYHFPCAATSGSFLSMKTLQLLCPEHSEGAAHLEEARCAVCEGPGELRDLLFCTSCGHHYHGACLDTALTARKRAGWQCPECKVCQACRKPGNDSKMLVCETCDKGYHTFCLKPPMEELPAHSWKCKACRVCRACGAGSAELSPHCEWFENYSLCHRCHEAQGGQPVSSAAGQHPPVCSRFSPPEPGGDTPTDEPDALYVACQGQPKGGHVTSMQPKEPGPLQCEAKPLGRAGAQLEPRLETPRSEEMPLLPLPEESPLSPPPEESPTSPPPEASRLSPPPEESPLSPLPEESPLSPPPEVSSFCPREELPFCPPQELPASPALDTPLSPPPEASTLSPPLEESPLSPPPEELPTSPPPEASRLSPPPEESPMSPPPEESPMSPPPEASRLFPPFEESPLSPPPEESPVSPPPEASRLSPPPEASRLSPPPEDSPMSPPPEDSPMSPPPEDSPMSPPPEVSRLCPPPEESPLSPPPEESPTSPPPEASRLSPPPEDSPASPPPEDSLMSLPLEESPLSPLPEELPLCPPPEEPRLCPQSGEAHPSPQPEEMCLSLALEDPCVSSQPEELHLSPVPEKPHLSPQSEEPHLSPRPEKSHLSPQPEEPRLSPQPEEPHLSPGPEEPHLSPRPEEPCLSPPPEEPSCLSPQLEEPSQLSPQTKEPCLSPHPEEPSRLSPQPKEPCLSPHPEEPYLSPRPKEPHLSPQAEEPRLSPQAEELSPSPQPEESRLSPQQETAGPCTAPEALPLFPQPGEPPSAPLLGEPALSEPGEPPLSPLPEELPLSPAGEPSLSPQLTPSDSLPPPLSPIITAVAPPALSPLGELTYPFGAKGDSDPESLAAPILETPISPPPEAHCTDPEPVPPMILPPSPGSPLGPASPILMEPLPPPCSPLLQHSLPPPSSPPSQCSPLALPLSLPSPLSPVGKAEPLSDEPELHQMETEKVPEPECPALEPSVTSPLPSPMEELSCPAPSPAPALENFPGLGEDMAPLDGAAAAHAQPAAGETPGSELKGCPELLDPEELAPVTPMEVYGPECKQPGQGSPCEEQEEPRATVAPIPPTLIKSDIVNEISNLSQGDASASFPGSEPLLGSPDPEGGGSLSMELGVSTDVSPARDEGSLRLCTDSLPETDDSLLCDTGTAVSGGKAEGDKGRRRSSPARSRIKQGRSSSFPGRRRPRGGAHGGRGRGRARLKSTTSSVETLVVADIDGSPSKEEEEDDDDTMQNTVVLFSNTDKFVLMQDMCVVCGSFGRGAEGHLLACSQCSQCYHPYCVNSKITKVMLLKGWRCVECIVCEVCGQASDPSRLLLCDDCDISYHTYCLDPPLLTVPKGGWKCKWCVSCMQCGAASPGFHCEWQNSYTHCGPCASLVTCPICHAPYVEEDLLIQCRHCERWMHAGCESLFTEDDVEQAADEGFDCVSCQPYVVKPVAPVAPPELVPVKAKEPEPQYFRFEGVWLTETGMAVLRNLTMSPLHKRRQRRGRLGLPGEVGLEGSEPSDTLGPDDKKDGDLDAEELLKGGVEHMECEIKLEGPTSPDAEPGKEETEESKKRKRKPYRPGIGGFMVRQRKSHTRVKKGPAAQSEVLSGDGQPDEGETVMPVDLPAEGSGEQGSADADEKKKQQRRGRKKSKLEDMFPAYLQEAFFGKELLDLSRKALFAVGVGRPGFGLGTPKGKGDGGSDRKEPSALHKGDDGPDVADDESHGPEGKADTPGPEDGGVKASPVPSDPEKPSTPGEGMLSSDLDRIPTEELPKMESKDLQQLFKDVLGSEREQHLGCGTPGLEGNRTPLQRPIVHGDTGGLPLGSLPSSSPLDSYPGLCQSPFLDSRERGGFFSPEPGEPDSPWTGSGGTTPSTPTTPTTEGEGDGLSYNQRSLQRWEKDEELGQLSTISPVLYANINFPNLKQDYPDWSSRCKQIMKLWRKVPAADKAPYLQKAKDNRAAHRINKVQKQAESQINRQPKVGDTARKTERPALHLRIPPQQGALGSPPPAAAPTVFLGSPTPPAGMSTSADGFLKPPAGTVPGPDSPGELFPKLPPQVPAQVPSQDPFGLAPAYALEPRFPVAPPTYPTYPNVAGAPAQSPVPGASTRPGPGLPGEFHVTPPGTPRHQPSTPDPFLKPRCPSLDNLAVPESPGVGGGKASEPLLSPPPLGEARKALEVKKEELGASSPSYGPPNLGFVDPSSSGPHLGGLELKAPDVFKAPLTPRASQVEPQSPGLGLRPQEPPPAQALAPSPPNHPDIFRPSPYPDPYAQPPLTPRPQPPAPESCCALPPRSLPSDPFSRVPASPQSQSSSQSPLTPRPLSAEAFCPSPVTPRFQSPDPYSRPPSRPQSRDPFAPLHKPPRPQPSEVAFKAGSLAHTPLGAGGFPAALPSGPAAELHAKVPSGQPPNFARSPGTGAFVSTPSPMRFTFPQAAGEPPLKPPVPQPGLPPPHGINSHFGPGPTLGKPQSTNYAVATGNFHPSGSPLGPGSGSTVEGYGLSPLRPTSVLPPPAPDGSLPYLSHGASQRASITSPVEKREEPGAGMSSSLVAPELPGTQDPGMSSLSQTELEKQRQRQRLRELLIRQQIQRNTLRQEKETAAAAVGAVGPPGSWGAEPSSPAFEQLSRGQAPFAGTQDKGSLVGLPPGKLGGSVLGPGPFPSDDRLSRPPPPATPSSVDVNGRQLVGGSQAFYQRAPYPGSLPLQQQQLWQQQQQQQQQQATSAASMRLAMSTRFPSTPGPELSRQALGSPLPGIPTRLPGPGEPVPGPAGPAQFIELRHNVQKGLGPGGAPFPGQGPPQRPRFYPVTEDPHRLAPEGLRGLVLSGLPSQKPSAPPAPELSNNLHAPPLTKASTLPAGLELVSRPPSSTELSRPPPLALETGKLPCEDPELDDDFDAHKALEDDEELAHLGLGVDVAKGDDELGTLENLETNDPHLDDLLNGDEFDLLAYTDPELDTGDKKDIFNEHLRLVESANEKAEREALLRGVEPGPSVSEERPPPVADASEPRLAEVKPKVEEGGRHPSPCQFTINTPKVEPAPATTSLGLGLKPGQNMMGSRETRMGTGPFSSGGHTAEKGPFGTTGGPPAHLLAPSPLSGSAGSSLLEKFELESGPLNLPGGPAASGDELDKMESSLVASDLPLLIEDLLEHEKKELQQRQQLSAQLQPAQQQQQQQQQQLILSATGPAQAMALPHEGSSPSLSGPQQQLALGIGGARQPGLGQPLMPTQPPAHALQQRLAPSMAMMSNQGHMLSGQHGGQAGLVPQQNPQPVLPQKPMGTMPPSMCMKPQQLAVQQQLANSFFPDTDLDKFAAEDIIDPIAKAKMVALKGIKKVMAQGSIGVAPGMNRQQVSLLAQRLSGGPGSDLQNHVVPGSGQERNAGDPSQPRPNPPTFAQGVINEADQRQYEEWLFHTQQLLQMQLKVLEEQIGVHRKSRKALCAKQRTAKKAGREFPEADAEKLKLVTEQQSKIQKQLDQVRKQQKEHTNLMAEYRNKQQQQQQQQQQHSAVLTLSPSQSPRLLTKLPGQLLPGHGLQPLQGPPGGQAGGLRMPPGAMALPGQPGGPFLNSSMAQQQHSGGAGSLTGPSGGFFPGSLTLRGLAPDSRLVQERQLQLQQQRMQLAQKLQQQQQQQQQHLLGQVAIQQQQQQGSGVQANQALGPKPQGLLPPSNHQGLLVQQLSPQPPQGPQGMLGPAQVAVLQQQQQHPGALGPQGPHRQVLMTQSRVLTSPQLAQQGQGLMGQRLVTAQQQQQQQQQQHSQQQQQGSMAGLSHIQQGLMSHSGQPKLNAQSMSSLQPQQQLQQQQLQQQLQQQQQQLQQQQQQQLQQQQFQQQQQQMGLLNQSRTLLSPQQQQPQQQQQQQVTLGPSMPAKPLQHFSSPGALGPTLLLPGKEQNIVETALPSEVAEGASAHQGGGPLGVGTTPEPMAAEPGEVKPSRSGDSQLLLVQPQAQPQPQPQPGSLQLQPPLRLPGQQQQQQVNLLHSAGMGSHGQLGSGSSEASAVPQLLVQPSVSVGDQPGPVTQNLLGPQPSLGLEQPLQNNTGPQLPKPGPAPQAGQGLPGVGVMPAVGQLRAQLQGVLAKNPQLRHLSPQQQQQLQALLVQRQLQQSQAVRQAPPFQEPGTQPSPLQGLLGCQPQPGGFPGPQTGPPQELGAGPRPQGPPRPPVPQGASPAGPALGPVHPTPPPSSPQEPKRPSSQLPSPNAQLPPTHPGTPKPLGRVSPASAQHTDTFFGKGLGPWDPPDNLAETQKPEQSNLVAGHLEQVNGQVVPEPPQLSIKQEPREESCALGAPAVKREANGEPVGTAGTSNHLLLAGPRSEAGHLLLQKLLRAKNVQLNAGRGPEGLRTEINGHIDSKLAGLEQKLQSTPINKEDVAARKPLTSKPKRVQKAGDRLVSSRKKLRKEDGLRASEALLKQLKQELSLLPLTEPTITANFSLLAPFGSGCPVSGQNQLRGAFGSGTLTTGPDYYSQLLTKNNLSNPPTPPSSLPPTPPPSVQQKMVNGVTASEELGENPKDATSAGDTEGTLRDPSEVKSLDLLAALPTPPHNQTEDVRMESDEDSDSPDSIVPASSPESILGEEAPRYPQLGSGRWEQDDRALSPVIPIIPRANIPVFPDAKPYVALDLDVSGKLPAVAWEKGQGSEVSVMLTVSAAAAKNLNGVMVAVAELLSMKIPNSYEVLFPESPARIGMVPKKGDAEGAVGKEKGVGDKNPDAGPEWLKQFDAVLPGYTLKSQLDILSLLKQESPVPDLPTQHSYTYNVSNLDVRQLSAPPPEEPSPPPSPLAPSPASPPAEPLVELPSEISAEPPVPSPLPLASSPESARPKPRARPPEEGEDSHPPRLKKWKGVRWKRLRLLLTIQKTSGHQEDEREVAEFMEQLGTALRPDKVPRDMRRCCFCHEEGDGATDGPARLLNLDLDLWVHLNCALWSTEVYETQGGALMNVEVALHRGLLTKCSLCQRTGATSSCNRMRCPNVYHFACAIRAKCMFFKDKTMLCPMHKVKGPCEQELSSFAVFRRVYIERDEVKQIASIIQRGERLHMFRVGGLVFHAIGQLLPHQMADFHSATALYPVGYEATRIYWSLRTNNRRCCYRCSISENNGRPEFIIKVMEQGLEDLIFTDASPQAVWNRIIEPVAAMRKEADMLRLFPEYLKGEELFGLTVHAVLRIAESLPGVESCQNYLFRYGRHPLMELPLMINPTGCARSEPKILTHYKRPHTLNSTSMSKAYQSTFTGETHTPYSKQFVHSKSSQYRRLRTEWKNNVYLARSRIQGLGLYAAKDLEKHTMVIEYIGTIIRNEVANRREKIYEEQNRGIYMFRINNEHVIDATLTGGPARYINHSCAPNCVAEVVTFDKEDKIIIISSRRIPKGEELTYDYQFDFEDDQHKIPCHCGAWNCRKWMN